MKASQVLSLNQQNDYIEARIVLTDFTLFPVRYFPSLSQPHPQ
jgi:hypothetical protein